MNTDLKDKLKKALAAYNEFADLFKASMLATLEKNELDGKLLPNIEMSECAKNRYVGTIKIWGTTNHLSRFCPYSFVFVSDHRDDDGKPIYKMQFHFNAEWATFDETLDQFVKREIVPWCKRVDDTEEER